MLFSLARGKKWGRGRGGDRSLLVDIVRLCFKYCCGVCAPGTWKVFGVRAGKGTLARGGGAAETGLVQPDDEMASGRGGRRRHTTLTPAPAPRRRSGREWDAGAERGAVRQEAGRGRPYTAPPQLAAHLRGLWAGREASGPLPLAGSRDPSLLIPSSRESVPLPPPPPTPHCRGDASPKAGQALGLCKKQMWGEGRSCALKPARSGWR